MDEWDAVPDTEIARPAPAAPWGEAEADELAQRAYVVCDRFLGERRALALRDEVIGLRERGNFRPARVGSGSQRRRAPDVRRDEICWFDEDSPEGMHNGALGIAPPPLVRDFLGDIAALSDALRRTCFLPLVRRECHASCYEEGAFYRAHVDTFVGRPERTISFVYFLNPGWQPDAGGCLRMYGPYERDVEPLLDRLVVFRSAELLHEVLPVQQTRYALTGWLSVRAAGLHRG